MQLKHAEVLLVRPHMVIVMLQADGGFIFKLTRLPQHLHPCARCHMAHVEEDRAVQQDDLGF